MEIIKKKNKHYRQLCWTCAKCYGGKGCSWIDDAKYPAGVELDDENFIISCPDFVFDEIFLYKSGKKTNKLIAENLGISERTFYRKRCGSKNFKKGKDK